MRVTNKQLTDSVKSTLFDHAEALLKYQTIVATRKKINKPSDDPTGMGKILNYRKILSSMDQYEKNIAQVKTKVEVIETNLESVDALIVEAKNLAQSNRFFDQGSRALAADQVDEIQKQVLLLANAKLNGSYLFAGHNTDTIPFSTGGEVTLTGGSATDIIYGLSDDVTDTTAIIRNASGNIVRTIVIGDGVTPGSGGSAGLNTMAWDGNDDLAVPLPDGKYTYTIAAYDAGTTVDEYVRYKGDNGEYRVVVDDGLSIAVNVDGNDIFTDVFDSLAQLQKALSDATFSDADIVAGITSIEDAITQINKVRAIGSSKFQRFEVMEIQHDIFKENYEGLLQNTESANMEKAIIDLQSQQTAYETSLAVASQIIQKSLVDFL